MTQVGLISDTLANANISQKSNALTNMGSNSVLKVNNSTSMNTSSEPNGDVMEVPITEPNDKASGVDENLEIALPEGQGHEHDREHVFGDTSSPMEFGERKRKNKKKKPKSKRGLVRVQYIVK